MVETKEIHRQSHKRKASSSFIQEESLDLRLDEPDNATSPVAEVQTYRVKEEINEIEVEQESEMQPPFRKRMRASYIKIQSFNSRSELDYYIRTNNEFAVKITHNEQVKCTLCEYNDDDHKMVQMYLKCSCSLKCDLK